MSEIDVRRSKTPFHPSMACQVVVTLDLNKKFKFKKILPGSIWEHTAGVCCAVENATSSTLARNPVFKSLMRANLKTPIKELMKQMTVHCDVNQITRARQEFIRKEVGVSYSHVIILDNTCLHTVCTFVYL